MGKVPLEYCQCTTPAEPLSNRTFLPGEPRQRGISLRVRKPRARAPAHQRWSQKPGVFFKIIRVSLSRPPVLWDCFLCHAFQPSFFSRTDRCFQPEVLMVFWQRDSDPWKEWGRGAQTESQFCQSRLCLPWSKPHGKP